MSSSVFEDSVDLTIGVLEVVPPTAEAGDRSYPLPALRSTGVTEARSFRTIVIENAYLRVTVLPDLGGRILSIYDKRLEAELLARPHALVPTPGGRRGVRLPLGIELFLDGEERPNAMGRVAAALDAPGEEDEPAGVWLAETAFHGGLGFHLHLSLPPDRAALRIEARAANRTFGSIPYNGGLALYGAAETLAVVPETGTFLDGVRREGGDLRVARFPELTHIGPRQVDTWAVHLIPLVGGATAASPEAAIYLDDAVVRVQAAGERPAHKLVLRTADGRTLEAPADLGPDRPLEIPLDGLPSTPVAVALLDATGGEVLRADRHAPAAPPPPMPASEERSLEIEPEALRRATFDPGVRGPAYAGLGAYALANREFEAADLAFEQSLLYNGDDPLAWWALAATRRLRGDEGERPELLNAHYLAPLEPILRAEAFLAQSPAMGFEPSPLIAPVAEIPEDLVEVACLLVEHGLLDQANRWIDEALRHHDLAMLRYLMADVLLRGTRMEAEAAEHVRAPASALVPPLPWRPAERRALATVVARFPHDAAASRLLKLSQSRRDP
ncbi:MAG: DUF5107 domain-containing protein [Fimbriimonas sp.]